MKTRRKSEVTDSRAEAAAGLLLFQIQERETEVKKQVQAGWRGRSNVTRQAPNLHEEDHRMMLFKCDDDDGQKYDQQPDMAAEKEGCVDVGVKDEDTNNKVIFLLLTVSFCFSRKGAGDH